MTEQFAPLPEYVVEALASNWTTATAGDVHDLACEVMDLRSKLEKAYTDLRLIKRPVPQRIDFENGESTDGAYIRCACKGKFQVRPHPYRDDAVIMTADSGGILVALTSYGQDTIEVRMHWDGAAGPMDEDGDSDSA